MKYTLIFFVILNYNAIAQNLISNGGFEIGTRIHQRKWTEQGDNNSSNQTLNGCDYWSVAYYDNGCDGLLGNGCSTPDWSDPAFTISGDWLKLMGSPPTSNVNKCAGLLYHDDWEEGVRTQLTHNLVPGKYYKLKLRMAIGNQSNTIYTNIGKEAGIRIHFAKYGPNWNASTSLSNNVKWIDAIKFSIPANSRHQWYDFEEYFRAPEEADGGSVDELANIIITQNKDKDEWTYLYVDDVELIETDPCNNPCTDPRLYLPMKLFCCNPVTTFPQGHWGDLNSPWGFKTENAMEIKTELIDGWGGIFLNKLEYDPNVLVNATSRGYGSTVFYHSFWDGKTDEGLLQSVSYSYPFIVTIKNCLETKTFTGDIDLISHFPSNFILPAPSKINRIKNCCAEFDEVKNQIFNSQFHKKANSYLSVAGGNNVTINSTDLVKFTAGLEIELKDGFETMDNASFEAYCASCIEGNIQKFSLPIKNYFYEIDAKNNNPDELLSNSLQNNDVINKLSLVYPNPIYDNMLNYKINFPYSGEIKYRVIDMYGSLKNEGSVIENNGQIELINLQSGVYMIEFTNKENNFNWITKFSKL